MYFSEPMVNAQLLGAFQNLSRLVKGAHPSLITAQTHWQTFFDTLLITYVTGENPNVTDSGFTFARKARQVLGVPEDRIVDPNTALDQALRFRPGLRHSEAPLSRPGRFKADAPSCRRNRRPPKCAINHAHRSAKKSWPRPTC